MVTGDTPIITSGGYNALIYTPPEWTSTNNAQGLRSVNPNDFLSSDMIRTLLPSTQPTATSPFEIDVSMPNSNRRFVQVFIADPNENVPLDKSVLFTGSQKLTDLNDTELFFEVPINDLLKTHNDARTKWLDKEATKRAGKDVFLDPVKIRDLKMVVVTIAQF